MPQPVLDILLIEDNPGDAELVKAALMEEGDTFRVHWVDALLPGLDRLARGDIDLVLLDISLPDSHGLEGLNTIRKHAAAVPVVLLTGLDNESMALQAVESGAQDYLVKGTVLGSALARTLRHVVVRQQAQTAEARTETHNERGTVVGLLGVKGGVGTTTLACHLARELKRQTGSRVMLLDMDGASNAIAFLMNSQGEYTILDASHDILQLDQDRLEKLVASGTDGVDIMQSACTACDEERQPKAERVRLVIRLVRSFYQYIVIDMGRLSPLSARIAEEASRLYLVSTCDVLGLNEAKRTAHALCQSGYERDQLSLILNQAPKAPTFSTREVEKILGVRVEITLPESHREFADASRDGKRLCESRILQTYIAQFAARIAGLEKVSQPPKTLFSVLRGAFRDATTGI